MFGGRTELEEADCRLWERLKEIEARQKWYPEQSPDYVRFWGPEVKTLTASEIVQRFDELYEYLGVERKQMPSSCKLEKKGKP